MANLTTIILTKNEENNIEECIMSVKKISKRIVVVDSYSEDKTVEIAKKNGADVFQHVFENYSRQFKYALKETKIETTWVLRLDADERISELAADEIEEKCIKNENTMINGMIIKFEQMFMGKWLRHGGMYPFKKLLVFKREFGDIEDRNMDEHIVLSEGNAIEIKEKCQHYDDKGLHFFVEKHNWYSDREVMDFLNSSNQKGIEELPDLKAKIKRFVKFKIYYKLPLGFRAHLYYIYRYYFLLGFLDGKEGQINAFLQAYWYRFLVDAKIYEKKKEKLGNE